MSTQTPRIDKGRRQFLKVTATGSSLALAVHLIPGNSIMSSAFAADHSWTPNLFLKIDPSGLVTITCHRSEMGQQIRTSIAQIIADELEADWSKIHIEQALGDPKYGDQNTDGSRSIRRNLLRLRQFGAATRQMLEQAAADQWQLPASECRAAQHFVHHPISRKKIAYGDLVQRAKKMALPDPEKARLKSRDQWRYIGKAVPSIDLDDVLQGKGIYGFDVRVPGMKVAVIARPPVLFGKVKKLNDKAALKVQGVHAVLTLPELNPPAAFNALGGVAVVADNSWAAIKGRDALEIEWEDGSNAQYDSKQYRLALQDTAKKPGRVVRNQGDVDQAFAQAHQKITAEYYVPHLSQAPMEPPCATANVTDSGVELWACTQTPQSTRQQVAATLGLEEAQVKVNVTLLGGGFGRKSKPDFSAEAALVSREIKKPVQVIWTREDDIRHGYYHSVSAQYLEASLDQKGNTTGWLHRTVFPSISGTFNPAQRTASAGEMRLGFVDNPYDVPNMRLENGEAQAHIRIGWLRSVANVYHAFAINSFAHELAAAAGKDPKDYLLQLIGKPRHLDLAANGIEYDNYGDSIEIYPIDTARLAHVVEKVAEMAQWSRKRPKRRALGIAVHRSFLSYVATVVEVEVDEGGGFTIPASYVAIDAGTVVNKEHVKAQCEGGSIYGLSCALGQINAENGAVKESNFNDYLVARLPQAPKKIDVHIVESDAAPGGVGEPPTPPFAPALCNALFRATGKRIRQLPIGDQLKTG